MPKTVFLLAALFVVSVDASGETIQVDVNFDGKMENCSFHILLQFYRFVHETNIVEL